MAAGPGADTLVPIARQTAHVMWTWRTDLPTTITVVMLRHGSGSLTANRAGTAQTSVPAEVRKKLGVGPGAVLECWTMGRLHTRDHRVQTALFEALSDGWIRQLSVP